MIHEPTNLVLGRGEVYFDRFPTGTRIGEGERYLGNTSTFRIQRNLEVRERSTSYKGMIVRRNPVVISENHTVNFTTDNVDLENLALWFGTETLEQTFTRLLLTEHIVVKKGRFYQLGKSQNVMGVRHVSEVAVKLNGNLIQSDRNYVIQTDVGRIKILSDAVNISENATLTVEYVIRRSDSRQVIATGRRVEGSLRFVAYNQCPTGVVTQNDVFIPYVVLSPRGQVDLKGDEWQQWSFDADVFNLNPLTQQVYVNRAARTLRLTITEESIIGQFESLDAFISLEDQLHQSVNFGWPPALELGAI